MTGTPITRANRADWLAQRRNSVGASEVAAAVGLSPWQTPIDLWQLKTGRVQPAQATWRMRVGLALEDALLDAYRETTHCTYIHYQHYVQSPVPHLTATLDAITLDGRAVELKTAHDARGWGDPGTDEIPDHYRVQVQAQMYAAGLDVADVAVAFLAADRFAIYTVRREPDLIDAMLARTAEFWGCVQSDTPPDWGKLDARALAILHPHCEGEITLPPEVNADVAEYERAAYEIRRLENLRDTLKDRILATMGDAELGRLSDGRRVKRYLQDVPERTTTTKAHRRHFFKVTKGAD